MSFILERELINHPVAANIEQTEIILEQMKRKICLIKTENHQGTGFFTQIYLSEQKIYLPVLITNNHILNEKDIKYGKTINISINNKPKTIIIDKNRVAFTMKKYDTTIIEIKQKQDEIHDFLELDEEVYNKKYNSDFIEKSVYILQYPEGKGPYVSYGNTRKIKIGI